MRRGKVYLFILICCFLPLTAYAESKEIIISCAELMAIEIEQPPLGFLFPGEACGDKCFYIVFTMEDATAQRVNTAYNAYKQYTRELYLGDHLLGIAEPFPVDAPYSQKLSTAKVYQTIESAMNEAQKMCPNTIIKVPDTAR